MALCKHPEEACCNMTFYRGETYCDNPNGFCGLHDELPPHTNADRIRAMSDRELAWWLAERYAKEAVLTLQDKGVTPSATEIKAVTERLYMTWARWLMAPAEVENGN